MGLKNLRVLFDTNIYGFMSENPNSKEFIKAIIDSKIIVYGSIIIRNELRNIPKEKIVAEKNLRNVALGFYDTLVVEKRNYPITSLIQKLAKEYENNYFDVRSLEKLRNDFLIVATASVHDMDIVCSNDSKTMQADVCVQSYKISNKKFGLLLPRFIKFEEFTKLLK